ncbi:acyl-CoA dehydrogenase family protein [Frankia sp. AgB32]|nr:acyl-CoA dehydrogenase family protein [Frankia sp. AgB32]MCL9796186.1 acyl-CoA dehydrogenase family protein [Frankia sp. AgKG'84/4]
MSSFAPVRTDRQGPGVDAVLTTTVAADIPTDDVGALREALRAALGTTWQEHAPKTDVQWRPRWPVLAELGLPAFCVPEALDGFGLRVDVAASAAAELGAALHASPFAGLTASAHLLAHCAGNPQAEQVLAGVLAGERVCAFGYLGAGDQVARLVDGAPDADALVLLNRARGEFLLLEDPADWTADSRRHGFDLTRGCADVTPAAGRGHLLRPSPEAARRAVDLYELLLAADAVGGVRRMLDRTITYAGQRRTFGKPIGGYQAVQHRLAEHTVRARGMALLVTEAARLLSAEPTAADAARQARRCVATASLSVSSGAPHLLHDLLQLTGAIGFTWEYGLHYYERRAHQDARLAANPRHAQRSLAEVEGWTDGS